ncbi:uncharacterized protein [Physcomitrium patens]|uniref:VQ domain-containing protein n=1 Tax=Physcomitrium patens TaxID=3218 RepID=A0A2K1L7L4_PHYPA|nr:vegetative cell wall protein gp1-like [Physcomitrium patens]XP_024382820.1 vegetative cell wall protein gp1-like [Physcomitrium patens]XP_024382827.1 vegetative cell wall protein gp1-like [Physcomitrium patens]XP_024382836.1 vegetative cell wall protein gp1-like [Physcomitrium patens]XP_024382847.1 vegetative cell wall protein gp1-like [Physcomitrium patens]PNR62028.1 hypothetical protein PHYPA_000452 [Physcomitrium patens]|eukprot:XP_024382810.1 vegetative cell wall protein gp1-like [Physcomitrella patens]
MAAPISMDLSEPGELGKVGKSGGSLAVSKSSSKIKKGLRPTLAQPRLAPQVYKTEPSDFRSLVQQLTGTSLPANPPPSGPKPPNSRLSSLAPPPLRPTGTYPALVQPSAQPSGQLQPNPAVAIHPPSFPFASYSPLSNHGASPFPVPSPLSFSPLPKLSPSDQVWVNSLESPGSAVIRQLAEKIAEGNVPASKPDTSATAASSLPPMSPTFSNLRFSSTFGLPSPTGFPSPNGFGFGLGNVYSSSSCFTPSAALAMDATFSFPEPDLAMSPASTP